MTSKEEIEEEYDNPVPTLDQDEESIDEELNFEPNTELRSLLELRDRIEYDTNIEGADMETVASKNHELEEIDHKLESNYSQQEIDCERKIMNN